jgi:nitrate reductase NapE component
MEKQVTYTYPMHPEIASDSPGNCPKCGMKLMPRKANKMSGHMILMLLLCLLPVIAVLLLPAFGVRVDIYWVLFIVLAACCILPMLFMRHSRK